MRTETPIDADFIRRIYRTSLVVWAVVASLAYAQWGGTAVIGLTIGTALALASLRVLEWAIRRMVVPGASPQAGGRILAVGFLKMVAVGLILTGVLVAAHRLHTNLLVLLLGVTGGFFLVHLVMFLKAIGIWLLDRGFAVTPADRRMP